MAKDDARLLMSEAARQQFARDFPGTEVTQAVQLFRAIRFLAQRINESQTVWLTPYGVSATKFNYLAVLYVNRREGLSAGDLGASVRTTSGTVTTMLKALEREGLVARDMHPTDGRSVVLRLTTKGAQRYLKCAKAHHAFIVAILEELGVERSESLLKLLIEAGNALHSVVGQEKAS